jgi:hypothetical protein
VRGLINAWLKGNSSPTAQLENFIQHHRQANLPVVADSVVDSEVRLLGWKVFSEPPKEQHDSICFDWFSAAGTENNFILHNALLSGTRQHQAED